MKNMPDDNSIDTASLATKLTVTLEANGIDAMFQKLEDSLRQSCRWHSLFDAHLLRARATLGLPLVGPVTDADKETKQKLDEETIAACREVGWKLFDEGQIASGWMYLRAAVETHEVVDKLSQMASDLLEQEENVNSDEEYQPLQEIIQLALWENLDPALGIRVMLAVQGTCNAVTAYEQSVAGLPPAQQEPVAKIMLEHLHEEVFENLARDLTERALISTNQIDEIKNRKGTLIDLLGTVGDLLDEESIHGMRHTSRQSFVLQEYALTQLISSELMPWHAMHADSQRNSGIQATRHSLTLGNLPASSTQPNLVKKLIKPFHFLSRQQNRPMSMMRQPLGMCLQY